MKSKKQSLYLPDHVAQTVKDINFAKLAAEGIKFVALDADSTLVRPGGIQLSSGLLKYLCEQQQLGNIEQICIASNRIRRNLQSLADSIGADLLHPPSWWIRKPQMQYFELLLNQLNCQPHQAVMVGDKVIYDIYGANRAGMNTVLVDPLGSDMIWDRLVRRRWRDRRLLNQHRGE